MTDGYMFATGWNSSGSLALVSPQPASPGLLYGYYESSSLGLMVPQGRPYTQWRFYDILTPSDYTSLLSTLGLSHTTTSNKCTVQTRDDDGSWITRNARVYYPRNQQDIARELAFWKHGVIHVVGLVATT